jgi:hypothetical protein
MWMWFLVKILIYHTFIAFLLKKLIFWDENLQITHMVSKHCSYYVKWHGSIYLQFSIKIKNHLNYFLSIFVFLSTCTLHSFSQIYYNLSFYKMKLIFFSNLLPKLYFNIICKNIVNFFWKFEVGYIQTCTSLESNTMWHPKGGHRSVLSPLVTWFSLLNFIIGWLFDVCSYEFHCLFVMLSFIFSPPFSFMGGVEKKWIAKLACEKYFCRVTY